MKQTLSSFITAFFWQLTLPYSQNKHQLLYHPTTTNTVLRIALLEFSITMGIKGLAKLLSDEAPEVRTFINEI